MKQIAPAHDSYISRVQYKALLLALLRLSVVTNVALREFLIDLMDILFMMACGGSDLRRHVAVKDSPVQSLWTNNLEYLLYRHTRIFLVNDRIGK